MKPNKHDVIAFIWVYIFLYSLASPSTSDVGAHTDGDYVPINWALITLGDYDYYYHVTDKNPTQKVENWIYSRGVPYDEFPDDAIEAPTDTPTPSKYPLQYANGTIRYQVIVLVQWGTSPLPNIVNKDYILWAVGNGTNAVVFGFAAKSIPELLDLKAEEITIITYGQRYSFNCTILKTFSDGIVEYQEGTMERMVERYYHLTVIQNVTGKTAWFNVTVDPDFTWFYGMFNTTYGLGNVWFNFMDPQHPWFLSFLSGGGYGKRWEKDNWKFAGHAINFMFNQVERVGVKLRNYKQWTGALVYRLDQDTMLGIKKPNEEAMQAGWVYDLVICPLGYTIGGGTLTDGMPENYTGQPSSTVKWGVFSNIPQQLEPEGVYVSRTFIVYNSTVGGKWDKMKIDWNDNKNFTDDIAHGYWENHTEATGVMGTYYWSHINNETDPTICRLGQWLPLRDRISDFTWWKEMGQQGYLHYGFHSWHHQDCGNETCEGQTARSYVMWNGTDWVMNQTWIEQKYTEARNELAYCLGSSGYGFEADKTLHSVAGAQYHKVLYNALGNLSWIYLTYHQGDQKEAGWYLCNPWQPASPGPLVGDPMPDWNIPAFKDLVNTLYSYFGFLGHVWGSYNLSYTFPPYTDMFRFVHLDESFEFWYNARFMKRNTFNAYAASNKIALEYKANSTLQDYVWMFPLKYNGKYFNGFSDNRTVGKIKHIDGKYVYIEFSKGGNERLEATYGPNPHIYQTSNYIENITQIYVAKNLTLQLWNGSDTINIKVNCTRLGQPNSIKINGTSTDFNYNPTTKICSFNVTFNSLKTVEVLWEHAPPNSPTLVSPAPASRFDLSKSLTFTWEFSDPDQGDSQFAYIFQLSDDYGFTSPIIDTGKVMSPSTQTTQTLPNSVGLYYWRVKTWDNRDAEGEWSDAQPIIVDKLKIILKGVTDDRTNVGTSVSVYFNIVRKYDNALFDGTKGAVYINGSAATWDETNKYWKLAVTQGSVGEWKYQVSSITDAEHNITTINDVAGAQKVIWDRLIVTINPDATTATVGTQVNFIVTAVYAYDNNPVSEFTANILRDGAHFATNNFTDACNGAGTHQYTIESITEKTYGLTAFTSNSPTVTWNPKPFSQLLVDWITSNILIIIPIIQFSIVLTYLLIRERKKPKNK